MNCYHRYNVAYFCDKITDFLYCIQSICLYIFLGIGHCDHSGRFILCGQKHMYLPYGLPGGLQLCTEYNTYNPKLSYLIDFSDENEPRITLSEFMGGIDKKLTIQDYYVYIIQKLFSNHTIQKDCKETRSGFLKLFSYSFMVAMTINYYYRGTGNHQTDKILLLSSLCIPILYKIIYRSIMYYIYRNANGSCTFYTSMDLFKIVSRIHWKIVFNVNLDSYEYHFYTKIMTSYLINICIPIYYPMLYGVDKQITSFCDVEHILSSFLVIQYNSDIPDV